MKKAKNIFVTLSLFTSISTLFCCAIPALLAAIGASSAFLGTISNYPPLNFIGEHKTVIFIFSGIMLFISLIVFYKNRKKTCPLDQTAAKRKACKNLKGLTYYTLWFSVILYSIGFYFAFLRSKDCQACLGNKTYEEIIIEELLEKS